MTDALAQAEELIPCEIRMISGCKDEQTSADGAFYNMKIIKAQSI
jgi:hypothetical protein